MQHVDSDYYVDDGYGVNAALFIFSSLNFVNMYKFKSVLKIWSFIPAP